MWQMACCPCAQIWWHAIAMTATLGTSQGLVVASMPANFYARKVAGKILQDFFCRDVAAAETVLYRTWWHRRWKGLLQQLRHFPSIPMLLPQVCAWHVRSARATRPCTRRQSAVTHRWRGSWLQAMQWRKCAMHVAQQLLDVTVDDVSRLALHSLWLGHVEDIWKKWIWTHHNIHLQLGLEFVFEEDNPWRRRLVSYTEVPNKCLTTAGRRIFPLLWREGMDMKSVLRSWKSWACNWWASSRSLFLIQDGFVITRSRIQKWNRYL